VVIRFSRALALVAACLVSLTIGASSAQASLNLNLGGLLGAGPQSPGPVPTPTTLGGAVNQLLGTAGSLLTNNIFIGTTAETAACPIAKSLAQLPPAGTPGVSQAVFVACVLHFLDFEWRTTHPGAPTTPALTNDRIVTTIGVPTPLNLDSDILPEALGTVLVLAPNVFRLTFTRIDLGLKGDLPSTAELVLTDPTGGSLPASHIGIGVNANGGRFPDSLSLTFTLESYKPPIDFSGPPKFKIDIDSQQQAKRAAITADLFDENASGTVRDSFVRGEVGMKPVPAHLSTEIVTGADRGIDTNITTTNVQTLSLAPLLNLNFTLGPDFGKPTVDAHVAIRAKADASGARKIQRLDATLTDLPSFIGLRYRPIAPSTPAAGATREAVDKARGGQTIDYAASSKITKLELNYDDVVAPAVGAEQPQIRAHAKVSGIPAGISVSQLGSFTSFDTNDTAGIASAEGEFTLKGGLISRLTPRPGVRLLHSKATATAAESLALAARIDGLHHAAFDQLDGRTVADVGIARQPFDIDARDEIAGLTAHASIEDLPAHAHIEYLPAQPHSGDNPGADKPLRFRYDSGDDAIAAISFKAAFDHTLGGHLDQIEGHINNLPPVIDVTADLVGSVYSFNTSKPFGEIEALARNHKAIDDGIDPLLTAGTTGASAVVRDNGEFAGKVRVQGLKNVSVDLAANKYHVEAGAVPLEVRALIDEVRGSGATREVLPRELLGTVDKLPASIDLAFGQDATGSKTISYNASAPIHKLALQVSGDKLYAPEPKINKIRATVIDIPATFTATLGSVGKLDLDAGAGIGGIETLITSGPDPALPADRHAVYIDHGKDVVIKAQLLGFKHFKLDPDPLDVSFETAASKGLDVDVKADLDHDAAQTSETTAHLDINNVPAKLHASYDKVAGTVHYDADGGAASGRVSSIHANATLYEARGSESLKRDVAATVLGVPSLLDLSLGAAGADAKKISYDANGHTDDISVDLTGDKLYAPVPKINRLHADVNDIPSHLAATLGDGGKFSFDGGSGTGRIDALVTSGPDPTFDQTRHQAYVENGDNVVGKVQLLGFKGFTLAPQPADVVFDTANARQLQVDTKLDLLHADGAPETEGHLTVNDVPAHMHASFDTAGKLHYDASQKITSILASAKTFQSIGGADLQRNLEASLLGVPATMDFSLSGTSDKTIAYDGSSKIDHIGVKLTGDKLVSGETRINRLEAGIDGIPAHLSATLGGDGAMTLDGGSGIDKLGALITSGADPALPANTHAAVVNANAAGVSGKVQLLGFKHFELAPRPLRASFDTANALPLKVDANVDEHRGSETLNRVAALSISKVPAHLSVALTEPTAGSKKVSYDASAKIDNIDLTLKGPKLYADQPKINRVEAHIAGISSTLTAELDANGVIDLNAGSGIGSIGALVTSGPDPALTAGHHAAYVANGTDIVAKLQLLGFTSFRLNPNPLDVTLNTGSSKPLDVDAHLDSNSDGTPDVNATLRIVNVPGTLHFKVGQDGSYNYDASDRISSIDLQAQGLTGVPDVPGKLDKIGATITGVPKHISAGFANGGRVFFKGTSDGTALDAVGSILVSAATKLPPALPTTLGASHVAFRQIGTAFAGEVKVSGLRQIDITPTPLNALVDTDVLSDLDIDAAQDANAAGGFEKSLTAHLHSNITKVTLKDELASTAGGHTITADTGTQLGSLDVHAIADNLPMGVHDVVLKLEGLPEVAKIAFAGGASNVMNVQLLHHNGTAATGTDGGLGLLSASVNGGVARSTLVNRAGTTLTGTDGLNVDMDNGNITTAALVLHGLRGVTYGTTPNTKIGIDVAPSQGKPMALDATQDALFAHGHVDSLPPNMLVELKPSADTPVHYSAGARISEIKIDTNFTKDQLGGILKGAQVRVRDVPTDFRVCFRTDGARASCVPAGNPFDGNATKKISAAYVSNVTTGGTRPTILVNGCLDSETCVAGGKFVTLDVAVAKQIVLEAGGAATGPTVGGFHCFDSTDIDHILGALKCAAEYPGNALSDALTSASARAFVFFDTGGQDFNGKVTYTLVPKGGVFTEPLVLKLDVPTLNASGAFLKADLTLKKIFDGTSFTSGGTMHCTGGSLGLSARFGQSLGSIATPQAIKDLVSLYNNTVALLPGVDSISIGNTISFGKLDVPIDWNLIPKFC
jgi:hypothetical protein